jgi:hypothetical protein
MSLKQIDEALNLILAAQKGLINTSTVEVAQQLYEASLILIKLRAAQQFDEDLAKLVME